VRSILDAMQAPWRPESSPESSNQQISATI